jgi:hypothetical protein
MKKQITIIILSFFLPIVVYSQELNLRYPVLFGIDLSSNPTFPKLVLWLYYMIIIISSMAAFGAIVWGGMEYLTSAGNSTRMQSGVEKIKDAVIGLLIVLLSYLVLQTISPRLIEVPNLQVQETLINVNYEIV